MEMLEWTVILITVLFLMALVLTWIIYNTRFNRLSRQIDTLKHLLSQDNLSPTPPNKQSNEVIPKHAPHSTDQPTITETPSPHSMAASSHITSSLTVKSSAPKSDSSSARFERLFGVKYPVWLAGIALTFSGFYLVKYSLDHGLLQPGVRILCGAVLGLSCLVSAYGLGRKSQPDNPVTQSLTGAGLAIWYAVLFAASSVYALIPSVAGLAGMAVITALAIILSLRYGPAIALIGLIGGFLTPLFVSSDTSATPYLLIYIYFIYAGILWVVKTKLNATALSRMLSLCGLAATLIWVTYWSLLTLDTNTSIWLGLFLFAVCSTSALTPGAPALTSANQHTKLFSTLQSIQYYSSYSVCALLMSWLIAKAGFGYLEWGLYGLIALSTLIFAAYKADRYAPLPWVSLLVATALFWSWYPLTDQLLFYTLTLSCFALLYGLSGYWLMWRTLSQVGGCGLSAGSTLIFYLTAYFKLHDTLITSPILVWSPLALGLGALWSVVVWQVYQQQNTDETERLYAITLFSAASFFTLGLSIALARQFLPVLFAAELWVVAWLFAHTQITVLRGAVWAFIVLFILSLLKPLDLLLACLFNAMLGISSSRDLLTWPLYQVIIPAFMFLAGAYYLRQKKENELGIFLEFGGLGLLTLTTYLLMLHLGAIIDWSDFTTRTLISNAFFVLSLGLFALYYSSKRTAYVYMGVILTMLALARIVYFDLILYNPLWTSPTAIRGWVLANNLLIPFGVPIIWLSILQQVTHTKYWSLKETVPIQYGLTTCIVSLLFILLSLNIHYYYAPQMAITHSLGPHHIEIYFYSLAWLLYALGVLLVGLYQHKPILRKLALLIMLLTVGKVFLYDARFLEGLMRALSFFCLGISLLGLHFLYTRTGHGPSQATPKP